MRPVSAEKHYRPPLDPAESLRRAYRARKAAWREDRIVAVCPEELPEPLRSGLIEWAEKEYGQ